MVNLPPEKLGSFYLGARYDNAANTITSEAINYDSRDLTTHAVCVGMTGSGKTGLCVGLLEEAAIDKVPAIIIDPKGDMTNLLLQFENLEAADFEKWINADDAGRKGMSVQEYAAAMAVKWKNGLADWGQDTNRIKALKNAVDYTVYTPGSDAGFPINIMGSFAAPGIDFDSDAEMLRERIQGTVAALLGMINSKADPVRSPEGILLATLFEHHWRKQEDLDLASLIRGIQKPPFQQLGVFDVDTFFPEKDRFQLAMDFNSLIASPQFKNWLKGDPLDIDKIYFTPEGKPRHSIFYIAHLSDSERMFFVTLLLNSLISWMRRQSGTTSLRSLLYFDEIFGYFPPTAQPPSKKPLLTILKQARAFGVGAVLVTQNPVDIDYKGLSNAGTWFIGKLQTERDKDRVLQGLEGAIAEAGTSSGKNFSQIISSLQSRVFLLHNVHDTEPIIYHTRWAMSYLRGPLTRPQVKTLMADRKSAPTTGTSAKAIPSSMAAPIQAAPQEKPTPEAPKSNRPAVAPGIEQRFFSIRKSVAMANQEISSTGNLSIRYFPMNLSIGKVRFYDQKKGVDEVTNIAVLAEMPDDFGRTDWGQAQNLKNWENGLLNDPDHHPDTNVEYEFVPESMNSAKEVTAVKKEFSNWLYQNERKQLLAHLELKLTRRTGESDEAFVSRVRQAGREERDEEMDKIQDKYEPKLDRIRERIRKEQQDLEEAEAEVSDRKKAEWLNAAETVFSVFVSRRKRSLSSAVTKRRMARKASQKLEESEEDLAEYREDFLELEQELQDKLNAVRDKWDHVTDGITVTEIKPRRADVVVDGTILVWYPYWEGENGKRVSAVV